MKTHLVRPIARLILLASAATLISCANQPSTGRRYVSNTSSSTFSDPWYFNRHCFHNSHHCKTKM
ncbi:hypothetical protein DES53_105332 [Roseimicrobium gellanilyticum]|uniref:Lipoprotein n=1 Tax=Roseimicrobium gellanilyticum TaxID=748857 RepID=A0A366HLY1_9BACT|nr:hypothetical protein [Roseimicrobium gellanilyticum]RBP43933.1 hypothetical protein DES53_105332 [Roseimicrobium gellanilyticum]